MFCAAWATEVATLRRPEAPPAESDLRELLAERFESYVKGSAPDGLWDRYWLSAAEKARRAEVIYVQGFQVPVEHRPRGFDVTANYVVDAEGRLTRRKRSE